MNQLFGLSLIFRKKFGRSFAILLPILLGIIFAVIPCVWLFDRALEQFVFGIICIFAGFLIGSFPGVVDEIRKVKITKKYIILAILGGLVCHLSWDCFRFVRWKNGSK